jgi:ABC-type transport system involved in multi-copper enzyme maturation permease subunit
MTAIGSDRPAATRRPAPRWPVALDAARSEWIKLAATPSTYWTLLATVVGMVGFGVLLTAAYARHYGSFTRAARAAFDPAGYSLSGFFLAQLAIAVLGALIVTSEYATGTIRPTLAAIPHRPTVLAAKAAVLAAVATITGMLTSLAAFAAGQAALSGRGIQAHLGSPGAARSVLGAGLYLAVTGLLALGLGTLIRRTAGAIAAVVGLLVILPVAVQGLPASWQNAATRYLPSAAGQAVIGRTKFTPHGAMLAPWAGFALYCAYTAAVLIASAILLTRRDT